MKGAPKSRIRDHACVDERATDSTRIACKDGSGQLAAPQNSLAGLITTRDVENRHRYTQKITQEDATMFHSSVPVICL